MRELAQKGVAFCALQPTQLMSLSEDDIARLIWTQSRAWEFTSTLLKPFKDQFLELSEKISCHIDLSKSGR